MHPLSGTNASEFKRRQAFFEKMCRSFQVSFEVGKPVEKINLKKSGEKIWRFEKVFVILHPLSTIFKRTLRSEFKRKKKREKFFKILK